MIYKKDNAKGIDKHINHMIDMLNSHLNTYSSWDVDIYHKIYREQKDGVFIPYSFVSDSEYKEVFINDKVNGEVGFYIEDEREIKSSSVVVPVRIIFSVDLDKLDNGSLQREDEKAMMIAQNAVYSMGWDVLNLKTGLVKVYEGFNTDRVRYGDMQPFLNFSFTLRIIYKNICDYELL